MEARQLAFGANGERHKVVTKGGLLIARSGAMTGGGGEATAARKLDQAQYAQMKQVDSSANLQYLHDV